MGLCRKRGNGQKCHAEPCAERVSVLFQHLIESNTYETLNPANGGIQGDKNGFTTQYQWGEGEGEGDKVKD